MTGLLAAASLHWTQWKYLNNTVAQWLGLLGVLLGSLIVGKIVAFVLDRQGRRMEGHHGMALLGKFLRCLSGPASMLIFAGGLYLAASFMTLRTPTPASGPADGTVVKDLTRFWMDMTKTVAVLAVTWLIFRMVEIVEYYLLRWTSQTESMLDDQLVPVIRKALRVFVVIVGALFVAQNIFDWNIGALVAGLGLGGLAFALAAQDMLSNFFGSVTIFGDRPFAVGDWISVEGQSGAVEEIGFRSTRIRTAAGSLVTIPNSTVAKSSVENTGARPFIRRDLNVTVTYDTTPEKITEGIAIIQAILSERANNFPPDQPAKVFFSDFNADSLNILVVYWFVPADYWKSVQFNHDVNMEILRRFNAAGIQMAFPTRTLYLKQDSPIKAAVQIGRED